LAVLRLPFAARTFAAALVGRLSYGTVFLSLTLALTSGSGTVGRAGAVLAVFGLAIAGLAPFRARLIDRHGPRRVLLPLSLGYAAGILGLAAATWHPGTPLWLLEALAAVTGAAAPPLGPTMRTLWREMCGGDQGLLQRAFSLDTVAEEVIGVSGPLLVGLLIVVANPAVGLVLSAALVATGTVAMLASPVIRALATPRAAADDPNPAATAGTDASPAYRPRSTRWTRLTNRTNRTRLISRTNRNSKTGQTNRTSHTSQTSPTRPQGALARIFEPVVAAAGVGLGLGAQNLVIVAFAVHHHQPSAIAWAEAGMSVGSILGGLAYGAITWRIPSRTRLPLLTVALGLSLAAAGLAPDVWPLTAVTTATGLFVSPMLTCAYLVADELADDRTRTSAGMWVNNSFNAGSSGGYAAMGVALARLPVAWCFALAASPVLLAAGAARARHSRADGQPTTVSEPLSEAARVAA
jgi:MFS family permease